MRITHPFHPYAGRQFVCIGDRYNRSGKRLLLRIDDSTICSVPPQWTDAATPDPEAVIGQERALFRVVDLIELARLVEHLSVEKHPDEV
ncbi:MAG: Y4bD/Y4pK family protein [Alphaproteobacteria bacterium]|nr:Y4bD/Y4pK family protein [Alphaproteobacteria bacterium]